jgi:hypothetical protein
VHPDVQEQGRGLGRDGQDITDDGVFCNCHNGSSPFLGMEIVYPIPVFFSMDKIHFSRLFCFFRGIEKGRRKRRPLFRRN